MKPFTVAVAVLDAPCPCAPTASMGAPAPLIALTMLIVRVLSPASSMLLKSFKIKIAFGQAARAHLNAFAIQSYPLAPVPPIPLMYDGVVCGGGSLTTSMSLVLG